MMIIMIVIVIFMCDWKVLYLSGSNINTSTRSYG